MKITKAWTGGVLRLVIVLASVVAAAASATAPKPHAVERSASVKSDFETTWSAVVDVFSDHQWKIETIDKSSGLIVTSWLNLGNEADTYTDCGSAPLAISGPTQVSFNVRVKDDGVGGTRLTVNTAFRQMRTFDGNVTHATCVSKGTVENMLNTEVAHQVAGRPRHDEKPAAVAASARGFFCSSSVTNPGASFCMRDKAACSSAYDVAIGVLVDLTTCELRESAWCFGERCAPIHATCDAQRERAIGTDGVAPACEETR